MVKKILEVKKYCQSDSFIAIRTKLQELISAIARSWHIRDPEKKQEVDLKASVIPIHL